MQLDKLPKPVEEPIDEKPTPPTEQKRPQGTYPPLSGGSRTIPRMPGQALPYLPPPQGLEVIIMDDETGRVGRAVIPSRLHRQSRHLGAVEAY